MLDEIETSINKLDINDDKVDGIILPSVNYKLLKDAMAKLDKFDADVLKDSYTDEDKIAVSTAIDTLRTAIKNNVLTFPLNNEKNEWLQKIEYADKVLSIRELETKNKKDSGNVSGIEAVMSLYNTLGVGKLIQVPLWHSGFWITLKAIKETDIIDLEMSIAENQIKLGRETSAMIYSNYSVVFNRIVMEFIVRHIQSVSIDVPNNNNISKYIRIQDLYPLVLGLIQSIYVKGFKDVRTCTNSTVLDDETGKPKCNYIHEATVDPKKLLWVDRTKLTDKHIEHMSKRAPKAVTIDECKEYQRTLDIPFDKEIEVETDNGNKLQLGIESPYVNKYITSGEEWVNEVIKLAEKMFTDDMSAKEKSTRTYTYVKSSILNMYLHYVTYIKHSNGTVTKNKGDIKELLSILSTDSKAFKNILVGIRKFMNESVMAIVGITSFVCPECGEIQEDKDSKEEFRDIIPLNMIENFFDLCVLKVNKISTRELEENM